MKKSLRRASLGALFAILAVPGMASAALTPTLSQSTVAAGCQPKGPGVIPNAGGGVLNGGTTYRITAVVGGNQTTPCRDLVIPTLGPTNYGAILQWQGTPDATAYRIYRGSNLLIEVTPTTPVAALGGAPVCFAANAASRCQYYDSGAAAATGAAPPALPDAQTAGGSSPDLNIVQAFDYADGAEPPPDNSATAASLKENILHFPAGLLANPTATTATCSLAQLIGAPATGSAPGSGAGAGQSDADEDKCPRASQVGTVFASIQSATPTNPPSATNPPTPSIGDIYLGEKLNAGDAVTARLFVALRPPCSSGYPPPLQPGGDACATRLSGGATSGPAFEGAKTLEVEKSFLSAKATIRQDGTFGIDNATTSVAEGEDHELAKVTNVRSRTTGVIAGQLSIQVRSLTQNLWGAADQGTSATADDKGFVLLPTSCGAKTLRADSSSYLDPVRVESTATLQATGCENIPFAPAAAFAVDATGQAGENGHPKFTAAITQAAGEAATKTAVVKLPKGLGTNIAAVGSACSQADLNGAGCPATSIVGSATATTPVLPGELAGPVYFVQNDKAGELPYLDVRLDGAAKITLRGDVSLDTTEGRLINTFNNLPEVTLSSFTLTVNGGPNGLLNNTENLCSGLSAADAVFTAHNDKTQARTPAVPVSGAPACEYVIPPAEKVRPGLTAKVKPKRDRKKPFRFNVTGRVKPPSGVTDCSGKVRVTVKKGKKRKARKTVNVRSNCKYAANKIKIKKPGKRGTAKFAVSYRGNSKLRVRTVNRKAKYGPAKKKK